jgi:succinyl-CoA synthetase beta subunit
MRLFEYQAKELFKNYGMPVPFSVLAGNVVGVLNAIEKVKLPAVLKAQVLAGGRGKAGGVVVVNDRASAQREAERIFSLSIGGERTGSILVEQSFPHKEEMYLSVTLDRSERSYVVIASKAGGIEVESLQGKVVRKVPLTGIDRKFAIGVASDLKLPSSQASQFVEILLALEKLSREKECDLAEINPLAVGEDGTVVPLDAKVILDDNALFRHPEFSKIHPADELEGEASREGFAFVRLEGDVAVVGNGAGLVLSTLDLVGDAGGNAACFLDLGGGAQKDRVEAAISLVNKLPNADRILVNIFGGITRTTDVAEGIKEVLSQGKVKPVFARISGAEEEEAKRLLADTPVRLFRTAQEAVEAAVRAS